MVENGLCKKNIEGVHKESAKAKNLAIDEKSTIKLIS